MAQALLLDPALVGALLSRRARAGQKAWLAGGGEWPLAVGLGVPTEAQARSNPAAVRHWVEEWAAWSGPGELTWCERRWGGFGSQRLPERLQLPDAQAVADLLGEGGRWRRAVARYGGFTERWPALAAVLPRHFDLLADGPDEEITRITAMLAWLADHPDSGLYPRQLPVEGLHSKWLQSRLCIMGDLLRAVRGADEREFYTLAGLAREPRLARLWLLDRSLRERVGGLRDISAPVAELARLALPVARLLIVENQQTALACGDLPGCVLIQGGGYAVDLLGEIPWLAALPCRYWGDIDTHGLAILNRLRHHLPAAESLLMDEETLLRFRHLCVEEPAQSEAAELPLLSAPERALFEALRGQRHGLRLRLEQERIPWEYAWPRLAWEPGCRD